MQSELLNKEMASVLFRLSVSKNNLPKAAALQNQVNIIQEQSFPRKLWENLAPDVKREAINQFSLVHLFKQINPDLHVCPKEVVTNTNRCDKGVQVPDRRIPISRGRKQRQRKSGNDGGNRRKKSDLKNMRDVSLRGRPTTNGGKFQLRADAPPHIPASIRQRAGLSGQPYISNNVLSASLSFCGDLPTSHANKNQFSEEKKENKPVTTSVGNENHENIREDGAHESRRFLESSSADEDLINVVLDRPEVNLERRWGYFFCRPCLHAWVSGSVWCVQGSSRVYIQQTCNFCNVIVKPKVGGKFRESLFSEKWTAAQKPVVSAL